MAGFLTGVFDTANLQDTDSGSQSQDQSFGAGLEEAFAYEETVGIGHSESVSVETPDGKEHSFSNGQDVSLTVGVNATLGLAADVTQALMSEDF